MTPKKNKTKTTQTKILSRGAEAVISKSNSKVTKTRTEKSYRHPDLDRRLRTRRTKSEAKILSKVSSLIPVPKIHDVKDFEITLDFIPGKKLSENLEKLDYKSICKQIGKNISILHNAGIIHGDLTTSNMILSNSASSPTISKKQKVYFIDFGLGFHSDRIEDKAVDLYLLSQALKAKHSKISSLCFKEIIKSYKKSKNSAKVMKQLEKVKMRGRYKAQY